MSGLSKAISAVLFVWLGMSSSVSAQSESENTRVLPTTSSGWSQAAEADIRAAALLTKENHPGYVDPANPAFKRLLKQAETNGLTLAKQVTDPAGYVAAIRRFSNTLQDGHAGAFPTLDNSQLPKAKWPGFVTVWRGDSLFVSHSNAESPAIGAKVTQCDGVLVRRLIERNVFAFRGRPSEAGNWWVEAPRLFIDNGNPFVTPPRQCNFVESNRTINRRLNWQEIDANFQKWRDESYNGKTLPVGMTHRDSGLVWIAMPTFQPNEAQQAEYRAIVGRIKSERHTLEKAKGIVLDLRNNQGGSSAWSELIAQAIWGEAAYEQAMRAFDGKSERVLWRTSVGNARYVESSVADFLKQGMPDIAASWTAIYKGMDAARERGEPFFTEVDEPSSQPQILAAKEPLPPLPAVYVIVPGQCASACLDALDSFAHFPNVKLIGAPSSADSTYMDVRVEAVPSGRASVIIPNKVYVGRPRGAGDIYKPSIEVRDLDWSTETFEARILADIPNVKPKEIPAAASTKSPAITWSQIAVADLNEIHELILENHPGPVDPLNPSYSVWLEKGLKQSLDFAKGANTRADYHRAIRLYLNGFRDGHMGFSLNGDITFKWPGFLTSTPNAGETRVAFIAKDSPVPIGARLLACDGMDADRLLDGRVHRYRTNPDLPQLKPLNAPRLFYTIEEDTDLIKECTFEIAGIKKDVRLSWTPVEGRQLDQALEVARASANGKMGVRQVGDVWFVSIPTFDAAGSEMQALLDEVTANIKLLHQAPIVVIDVRGNGGGNSNWGSKVASALWDQEMVEALENSFDWTTDWRVSQANIDLTKQMAQRSTNPGLVEDDQPRLETVKALENALVKGEKLLRKSAPATSTGLSASARSRFKGKTYLLTDSSCASACLDFADIVTRLPNVVHVGLPTSADAIYIDVVGKNLSSGMSRLSWSLKVYRNRIRGNNQWYEPKIRWPGGVMTDEAIAAWVKEL